MIDLIVLSARFVWLPTGGDEKAWGETGEYTEGGIWSDFKWLMHVYGD